MHPKVLEQLVEIDKQNPMYIQPAPIAPKVKKELLSPPRRRLKKEDSAPKSTKGDEPKESAEEHKPAEEVEEHQEKEVPEEDEDAEMSGGKTRPAEDLDNEDAMDVASGGGAGEDDVADAS